MLDNIKGLTYSQEMINQLIHHPDFEICRPKTNNYYSLKHKVFGVKLSFDFRKAMEGGKVIGYRHLEINLSPHYHFNNYLHNGNDFTPEDCIKTLRDILNYLKINPTNYNLLKIVNVEFAINTVPENQVKNLINGLYFHKRIPFKVESFPYFRKTDATSYKQIKAYAKGLQFIDFPQYGIDENTFRFEVKTKQSKKIREYGIQDVSDLLCVETYSRLGQSLLDEWQQVLLINLEPDLKDIKSDEVQYINKGNDIDFWNDLITEKHRNTFGDNKAKYYKILQGKNNFHHLIKLQIIDKLFSFSKYANSTQRTLINTEKDTFLKTPSELINLESAHFNKCLVTGLNISMQRKGSKFLCVGGLKYYKENKLGLYKTLEEKYLSTKMNRKPIKEQMYNISHNIRNSYTNLKHNRKRMEVGKSNLKT